MAIADTDGDKYYHPYYGSASYYSAAYYNGAFTDNHRSKATIQNISNVGYIGVVVRCDGNDGGNYYVYIVNNAARWIEKRVDGVVADIATVAAGVSVGNTIELRVNGSTITAYLNGAVDTALGDAMGDSTGTAGVYGDTSLTTGKPGIMGKGVTTVCAADNWEGENI